MSIELKDKLAERIRKRREEAAATEQTGKIPPVAVAPVFETLPEISKPLEIVENPTIRPASGKVNSEVQKLVAFAVEAIEQNKNPMQIAKMLSAILEAGLNSKELADEIRMSKAWVSKRLGLLKAPQELQQQIEAGLLSEHEYYNHRSRVEAESSRKKKQTLQYARMPTVTISIEAAHALAGILKKLTITHNLMPITLDHKTGKKELVSILNLRPLDILKAIK
jgi:hypothetical protein